MKATKLRHPIEAFGTLKARPGDIRVEALETRLAPRVAFPHRHDFYHLILITHGSGWHEIDFTRHKVLPKTAFLMKPGQVHAWQMNAGTKGFVVEFTTESIRLDSKLKSQMLSALENSPDCWKIKANEFSCVEDMARLMLSQAESKNELLLSSLLCAWVSLFLGSSPQATGPQTSKDLIESFKTLIDQWIEKEHGVGFYAGKLGVTPKALTNQLMRHLGKAPRMLLQDRLSLEAKRRLAYSNSNVSEVAMDLGFEDFNYFARFFKKQTGLSPSDFRKKVRG